ncbi:MAG: hypothetical protein ACRECH_16820, partial [Nitrososphaerales archaeon]
SLAFGYFKPKLFRIPKISDLTVVFGILEDALTRSFPDLPSGFTWTEGIARAKNLKLRIEWKEVERMLRKYEAYRYGTDRSASGDTHEVLKLAYGLPRKPKYDRRSKG